MKAPIRDGGTAFPIQSYVLPNGQVSPSHDGMTLRHWFAGMALSGILSDNQNVEAVIAQARLEGVNPNDKIADKCYVIADAMVERGEKAHNAS